MWMTGKRKIGDILKDGGLISDAQLARALEEQTRTNELLGEVLVRMGMLNAAEVNAALAVQEHLGSLEQAVRLAAGVREMLGDLLLRSGKVSAGQLEQALAEHRRGGKKLGESCVGLGLLSQPQLEGLLAFQRQQETQANGASPLRLGELLVCAGYLSREQLDEALIKQAATRKRLGEVLVEEGYVHPTQVSHGLRLQQVLMSSVLAAILSFSALTMSGCGSGGGESAATPPTAVATTAPEAAAPAQGGSAAAVAADANYFTFTDDQYGLIKPDFLYSTDNAVFWSIQANVAKSATDIDALSVCRIDIPKQGAPMPELNKTFALEEGTGLEKFPGSFLVVNGKTSTGNKVERGTISFTADSSASGKVTGSFDVTLTDYDAGVLPAPQYRLKGSFRFVVGSYGPAPAGS